MADQTLSPTLDPFSTAKPKENAPLGGKVGYEGFEDSETDLRNLPEYIFSSGSIPFNKVKETLIDSKEAAVDLGKWILGVGVETSEPVLKTDKPIYGEGGIDEEKIKEQQRKIEVMNTIPLEKFQQLANEALMNEQVRVLGGIMTEEDADLVGSRLELMSNTSSIHFVARKRGEAKQQVITQQANTEIETQTGVDHADKVIEREGHWGRNPG